MRRQQVQQPMRRQQALQRMRRQQVQQPMHQQRALQPEQELLREQEREPAQGLLPSCRKRRGRQQRSR
jgi:hypothetical protein